MGMTRGFAPYNEQPLTTREASMVCKLIVTGVAVAILAGSSAFAQSDPPPANPTLAPSAPGEHRDWHRGICVERFARLAGRLAYLEAKLELTAEQRPLWDNWRGTVSAGATNQRDLCQQFIAQPEHPTIVERQARFGQIAAARAQTLQTAQPALEALYQALSPAQKAVLDHPMNGEGRHGWRRQEFRHQPSQE